MRQTYLDAFIPEVPEELPKGKSKTFTILMDFAVTWFDGDWYLSARDIVDLDPELSELMVKRSVAEWLSPHDDPNGQNSWTAGLALQGKQKGDRKNEGARNTDEKV